MEGHHNFDGMMGMHGEPKQEKPSNPEETPDFAGEIGHRAELVQASIESLSHDMTQAEKMLADIRDPDAKKKFADALERLRNKVGGIGDPRTIAQKMLDERGEAFFEKKDTPPEEMN